MHKDHHDKENQVPPITFDFKKKCKPKANSDRTNSNPNFHKIQNICQISSNTMSLLQKKKQYAQAIRQKNLKKQGKKQQLTDIVQANAILEHQNDFNLLKISNINPCNNSQFYSVNIQTQQTIKSKRTQSILKLNQLKTQSKTKCRSAKKQKSKMKQMTKIFQGMNENDFKDQGLNLTLNQNYLSEQLGISPDYSLIQHIHDGLENDRKYQIYSKEINEMIEPNTSEQLKEIELLRKQNNTFKKELANFRRDNTSLKRQNEDLKKQLSIIQERNQYLQSQSSDQLKLLQSFQIKVSQSFECLPEIEPGTQKHYLNSQECDDTLKKIITNYENELFNATNLNKKLQFKNYMLEKRLMDETETHKKKMAKEISVWKERYIKARNQNLKLKDSRSQLLFEMSISQEL